MATSLLAEFGAAAHAQYVLPACTSSAPAAVEAALGSTCTLRRSRRPISPSFTDVEIRGQRTGQANRQVQEDKKYRAWSACLASLDHPKPEDEGAYEQIGRKSARHGVREGRLEKLTHPPATSLELDEESIGEHGSNYRQNQIHALQRNTSLDLWGRLGPDSPSESAPAWNPSLRHEDGHTAVCNTRIEGPALGSRGYFSSQSA